MRCLVFATVMAVLAGGCAGVASAECDLAIEHVNVVPMDRERILADRTVVIAQGRIVEIGRRVRSRCQRHVDGASHYLMPGLVDSHVHVEAQAFMEAFGLPPVTFQFEDLLFSYLAHGVTGIRIMSGSPDLLAFRSAAHGPAPRMVIASPMLSGAPPILPEPATRVLETSEEANAAIAEYAAAGYDLIKIRGNLQRPVLEAVFSAAAAHNLDVDGHIPNLPDWSNADMFSGRQRGIAHLDELALRVKDEAGDPGVFARGLRNCHCYVTTTMQVEQSAAAQLRDYDAVAARPDTRFVHPLLRMAFWARERDPYLAERPDPAFFDELMRRDQALVRAFHREDVTLLAGTDAMSPMIIPGVSLADELALLVEAGLSPYEALSAATRTPSEVFSRFSDAGVVARGRAANLILLSGNPLHDIAAVRRPEAIIIEGRYLDRMTLDARMEQIAAGYAQ